MTRTSALMRLNEWLRDNKPVHMTLTRPFYAILQGQTLYTTMPEWARHSTSTPTCMHNEHLQRSSCTYCPSIFIHVADTINPQCHDTLTNLITTGPAQPVVLILEPDILKWSKHYCQDQDAWDCLRRNMCFWQDQGGLWTHL